MSFNANSYYRNKYRKTALAKLEEARSLKARMTSGEAYEWEGQRLPTLVELARIDWRMYLSYRTICGLR